MLWKICLPALLIIAAASASYAQQTETRQDVSEKPKKPAQQTVEPKQPAPPKITFLSLRKVKEWSAASRSGNNISFVSSTPGPGMVFAVVRYKVVFDDEVERGPGFFAGAELIDSKGKKVRAENTVTEKAKGRGLIVEQPFHVKASALPVRLKLGDLTFALPGQLHHKC